jgi:hypothetical protein
VEPRGGDPEPTNDDQGGLDCYAPVTAANNILENLSSSRDKRFKLRGFDKDNTAMVSDLGD